MPWCIKIINYATYDTQSEANPVHRMVRSMLRYISSAANSQSCADIPRRKIRRICRAAATVRRHIDEHRLIWRTHRAIAQTNDESRKIEREIVVQLVEYQEAGCHKQHSGLHIANYIPLPHPLISDHAWEYQSDRHHKEIDSRLGIYAQLLLAINGKICCQRRAGKSKSYESQSFRYSTS